VKKKQGNVRVNVAVDDKEWDRAEEFLLRQTPADLVVAVLEAGKIFNRVLGSRANRGGKKVDQIYELRDSLADMPSILTAHKIRQKMLTQKNFELDIDEAEYVFEAYKRGALDLLSREKFSRSISEKVIDLALYLWEGSQKKIRQGASWILGLLLLIIFLADTTLGRWIASVFVAISHFVWTWLVIILIFLAVAAVVLISLFAYLGREKKE